MSYAWKHIRNGSQTTTGGLVISLGSEILPKNSGMRSETFHKNSRGVSQISQDIWHQIIYTKVKKASKHRYNTIISTVYHIYFFHFQRLCTKILGGHIFCNQTLLQSELLNRPLYVYTTKVQFILDELNKSMIWGYLFFGVDLGGYTWRP